jgi:hypothetical protein
MISLNPGDVIVESGSDVSISARVRSRFGETVSPGDVVLEWQTSGGAVERLTMTRGDSSGKGPAEFAAVLPHATGTMRYRVVRGDVASLAHTVTAVDPPAVIGVTAQVEPPPYTRKPAATARDAARIDAWEDSRVTLSITANRALARAELKWPVLATKTESTSEPAAARTVALEPAADRARWSVSVIAEQSGPFTIALYDDYGLASKPERSRRLVVEPDLPPSVAIAAPGDFKETNPDDELAVAIGATDDVAVASVELHYTLERGSHSAGPTSGRIAALLAGLGSPRADGQAVLALGSLKLEPGDVVSYRVCATDNRPAPRGAQVAWSETHSLQIVEHSESLGARQATAERDSVRARLEAAQKAAKDVGEGLSGVWNHADLVRRGKAGWDPSMGNKLVDREAKARRLSDDLAELSRDLDGHPSLRELARPVRQVAEVEAQAVIAALDSARRSDDSAKRLAAIGQAGSRLATLQWKVESLKRKFDELARQDEVGRQLDTLARSQEALANRTERSAQEGDRSKLDPLTEGQEQLRKELAEVIKQSPALRALALGAEAQEADALAQRARALANAQRDAARRTSDTARLGEAVKALAEKQRAIEDDARRLAVRVDEPLTRNGRGRVDVDGLARAGAAIESGEFDQAHARAREAENALERLARDVVDVRQDPKALARRLVERQEALKNETVEAIRSAREHPPETPEGKTALAERMKPLLERQKEISKLAAAIQPPPELGEIARDAARKTDRASDDVKQLKLNELEGHQGEARDALNRVADALPDANQLREKARQKLEEARSRHEEIARELEKHLRETALKPDQPYDATKSAADLAERLAPLANRERELAQAMRAIDPEPRLLGQRDRAANRMTELADALEAMRAQAPAAAAAESRSDEPKPLATWHVLGAFALESPPVVSTDKAIDLSARFNDRKGQQTTWRSLAAVDAQGTIDLGQCFGRDDKLAALGYCEVSSPFDRTASMLIGSDDRLTVWLNGQTVYDFRSERAHNPGTDRVDVKLSKGINRILVRCGNLNGEWKYSVALTPPPESYRPITDWRVVGPFPSGDKPPLATDRPVELGQTFRDRKGKPAAWQGVKPINDRGAIDLAKHFSTRDAGIAAFGYANVISPTARRAHMLIGSNDTFTVWFNGKQIYDSQLGRSWAPDHARIDVPLEVGDNRLLVKCGNTGGNWMFSVALSEDPEGERPTAEGEIANQSPKFERMREGIPAVQVAARAAIERFRIGLDRQQSADELARAVADDQHDLERSATQAAAEDGPRRAELAAEERRIANALAALDAPDAPVAKAEAVRLAEMAARALEAPPDAVKPPKAREAIAGATIAAEALARRLADLESPRARATQLAHAQRKIIEASHSGHSGNQAREERELADELARLPAKNKAEATEAVARAAELLEAADRAETAPRSDQVSRIKAMEKAAQALEKLAAKSDDTPPPNAANAGEKVAAPLPEDSGLDVTPADHVDARALARRQRHIREGLQAILGEGAAVERTLREQSTELGRAVASLRGRTAEISPQAKWPAQAATDQLSRHAPERMDHAIERLTSGHSNEALSAQRQAADAAEQAARYVEDLATALRASRPAGNADLNNSNLAEAQAAMRAASESLSTARAQAESPADRAKAARAAAAAMQSAARELRALDRSSRGRSGPPGPSGSVPKSQSTIADHGAPDLAGLKPAARAQSARAWGELPGHLRTEILESSQGQYREDYARLIELYFREIATEASRQGAHP